MDELATLMLSQLAGGDGVPLSMADLVEQQLGDDPAAATVAAMLRQREAAASQKDDDDEADAVGDPEAARLLERLYAENDALRQRNRALADALGACPRCWGDDELCPVCRGRGVAGGRIPDGELFDRYVEPAWRRRFGGFADELLLAPRTEVQP
jgi:hypothetical protein